MVQASSSNKNLWVAASDGDYERVQYLIESEGMSPNDKDSNSYTPMHAASSYAHLDLLSYLLSKGGDINITDDDGETPLFVVETIDAARFLVEHGVDVAWKNEDGLNAADQLEEDHPEISSYLYSLLPSSERPPSADGQLRLGQGEGDNPINNNEGEGENENGTMGDSAISQLALENFTSTQSDALMIEAQKIMEQCAITGEDPDEKLRQVVEKAIKDGLSFAQASGAGGTVSNGQADGVINDEGNKRIREE
ncbi:uncharacterized protein IL334_004089 [Kwoniella shivajii]|uniref:Ankyrin repeat-containing protein n=1 Tax=Kwoniella shivajii TaxID=564305 RepID=A0ABZ1CZY8_9TREE|nr:hypothetical protein IL334_004089 [Kwoniella shivajii]